MVEAKYYLKHALISIIWAFSSHKQSMKTFYQCFKFDLIAVVMIESEKSWKYVSIFDIVQGMIETIGKSKATQKMKYTGYINVIVVAWT